MAISNQGFIFLLTLRVRDGAVEEQCLHFLCYRETDTVPCSLQQLDQPQCSPPRAKEQSTGSECSQGKEHVCDCVQCDGT